MLDRLRRYLSSRPDLEIAVLIGSRACGTASPGSDWDIAVQWSPAGGDMFDELAREEELRRALAAELGVDSEQVDLIDLSRAGLTMRAVVAEEGVVLKGDDDLPWFRFLSRTWRDLEDWYWEQEHAA